MKIKLFYKFFIAFVGISLLIVGLLLANIQFFTHRNFADYVNKVEMGKLADLIATLGREYRDRPGWEWLRHNPANWRKILLSSLPRYEVERPFPPPSLPHPLPPPPSEEEMENPGDQGGPPPPHLHDPVQPDERFALPEQPFPPPPPLPPGLAPIASRISVFDQEKHHIVGKMASPDGLLLSEIKVSGQTAGWLGLDPVKRLSHPLDVDFLRQQTKGFYIIGCLILLVAAIVSIFMSKHLTVPIGKLMAGTRALASRNFETTVDIQTGDELGQLASDFNAMALTLKRYEQIRKQWLSDISHELRTPLSILRGEIEALQDGIREVNSERLASLHFEIVYISKIVNDLHELSIAESGALYFDKRPIDPIKVLRDTLGLFQLRLTQEKITLQDELITDPQTRLLGDAGRLAQLFSNLIENTLRYADRPGNLRVSGRRIGTALKICFEDSGPGVPEESLGSLFDRLYRVDASRSRAKGGSGLGLAICKNIAISHGGTISAANSPSGGLLIDMTFPLHSSEEGLTQ
ncbi:MAG: HAMP domain-containing protein [Deltaproteobacteria bacterium]|nr:HAMP domain-containing protein [Deltaproteobacteria bacterium]